MRSDHSPTILVTGSTGMLGRALCETLSSAHPVVGISKRGLQGSIACDLSDAASVRRILEKHPVRLVINTAAYSDVDDCEREPKLAYDSNALVPKVLSGLCSEKKIPWIQVSTEYIFNGKKNAPYVESDEAAPVSVYGMTKWVGEYYAMTSASPAAVVRTSWLFGLHRPNCFVNAIAARLKNESVIWVLNNQTDAPTSVKDLSLALKKIADYLIDFTQKSPGKSWNEVFHVCNSGSATHYDMTLRIRDLLGLAKVRVEKTAPELIKNRIALRPLPYVVMSNEKFQKFFGMKLRSWQESLADYLKGNP
jgi:dTDP-4-dehydrorhamnose reductase